MGNVLRREIRFTLTRPGAAPLCRTVFWDISTPLAVPPLDVLDFAAVAVFFLAMRHGASLVVQGRVTAGLMRNLEELNEAWVQLCPDRYFPIRIDAAEIVADRAQPLPGQQRAVVAFSGGLDSSYTLVRHVKGEAGLRSAQVRTALMVHGFDIPLEAEQAFATARASAARTLDALGVPLSVIRTNWREAMDGDWEMEHMAALTSCLHHFAGPCDIGILGSDMTYAFQFHPWGSNPSVDPLLAGGRFALRIEGGGIWRTARAAAVWHVPEAADNLRVCWAGPLTGGNCGRCEKCVRTQLNFLALGHDPGPAFPVRAGLVDILFLNARHAGALSYLTDILRTARTEGIAGAWVAAARINWHCNRALLPFRPHLGSVAKGLRVLCRRLSRRVRWTVALERTVAAGNPPSADPPLA